MLGIFRTPPVELVVRGDPPLAPKTTAAALMQRFAEKNVSAVFVRIGDSAQFAYTDHHDYFQTRSFGVKEDVFCLYQGRLKNLKNLKKDYDLAKDATDVCMVIKAYQMDRTTYAAKRILAELSGNFSFVLFDKNNSNLFVARSPYGSVPLFLGVTSDGYFAICDDLELLYGACGKSSALFPEGFYCSPLVNGFTSFGNPEKKITPVLANEGEICGVTYMVTNIS